MTETDQRSIERRDPGDALSQIVGTGDTRAMLEQVERNVRTVIDVARDRGFVQRYGDNQHEFFGEPAWSLLGMTYGLVAFVEYTKAIDNGWEARAVARTREGQDVAAAEAMCTRAEPNKRNATDHTLRAMAQTRARRNALRSALGAALVLSGFDFADPDAPATPDQIKAVWTLAGKQGYDRDEAHERAGVDSMKELTREQAAELIDAWSTLGAEGTSESVGEGDIGVPSSPEGSGKEPPDEEAAAEVSPMPEERSSAAAAPASNEQWARAAARKVSKSKVLSLVNKARRAAGVPIAKSATDITQAELGAVLGEKT